MRYPKLLQKGDTIGICAPSAGTAGDVLSSRLDRAISDIFRRKCRLSMVL